MTIDRQTIGAYERSRNLAGKPFPSACYAPFTSLYFNTNGDVNACCKNSSYLLGNIARERLDDIWHGRRAQGLRRAMREYKLEVGCQFCEWQITGGQYDQVYATVFDDLPVRGEDAEWPSMMEFTLSNTCNLACIMCFGALSSTIRAKRDKLPPLPRVYGDEFFEDLRKYLPHLTVAKFFGGEPFLCRESYRIWDMMIEDGITIPCHITTNATQFNERVEQILDAFPCSLALSLDGVTKETVESIRVYAKWEECMANVERFLDYARRKQGAGLSLTYCLMRQNWHEFGDYLKFGEERGLTVFINTVAEPEHCSLYTLPPEELEEIAGRMEQLDKRHHYSRLELNGRVWTSAVEALHKNARQAQREKISEFTQAAVDRNPVGKAWRLVGEGKLAEALTVVARVPEGDQQYYARLVLEGHVLRRQNRLDEAEARLDEAVALFPKGPNAYVERAWLRLQQERTSAAVEDARRAAKRIGDDLDHPNAADAFAVLGHALAHSGQFEPALAAVDKAVALKPDDAWMHLHRGWVLAGAARLPEAMDAVTKATELSPENPELPRLREYVSARLAE